MENLKNLSFAGRAKERCLQGSTALGAENMCVIGGVAQAARAPAKQV
jgi:hypothetical protein